MKDLGIFRISFFLLSSIVQARLFPNGDFFCDSIKLLNDDLLNLQEHIQKWLVEQSSVSSMLRVIPVRRGSAQSFELDMFMARGVGFALLKYV